MKENIEYDNVGRFISYYYQISSIIRLNPKSILEIGVGKKVVYNYLKGLGLNIVSCDHDKGLRPDYVADIRKLPFNKKFDVVVSFEVLEHLPFSEFETVLKELKRVGNYVIISIPYAHLFLKGLLNFKIPFTSKQIVIPRFWVKFEKGKHSNEHYWEMGTRGYSKKRIRSILNEYFNIVDEFYPMLNPYHYFFILEAK